MKPIGYTLIIGIILVTLISASCTKRQERSAYTIGLSMYSLRQMFKSGELAALDYPKFAKETFGISKVDVWYGGFPEGEIDNPDFYTELRERAEAEGVEIFLLMAGILDVTSSDLAELQAEAKRFFIDVDRAALLGSSFVRLFVKAPAVDREIALNNAVAGLRELVEYAASKGIVLAIEPGASDWTRDGAFLADIAKAVNHPACKLMPDFGKLSDPYVGTLEMMPYTVVVSAKTHNIYENGEIEDFDYSRLLKIITDGGFTGIVAIEYEGENIGPVEGVRATQKILKELNN